MKNFLETYPLYKWIEFQATEDHEKYKDVKVHPPAVNLDCSICESKQTYRVYEDGSLANFGGHHDNNIYRLEYVCAGCKSANIEFLLFVHRSNGHDAESKKYLYKMKIQKIGQFPAWSINPDPGISKLLGEHVDTYKKGLVCESQGYGIGAFAYYRRIVEDNVESLLNQIKELVEDETDVVKGIEEVKAEHNTEQRIRIASTVLPESLQVAGNNPLSVIYSALSEGLHVQDDETCLNLAHNIREALTYLVHQINLQTQGKRQFTESLKQIVIAKTK